MSDADKLARKIADTLLAQEGTGPAFGIEIEEAREGYARLRMKVRADMLNGHAMTHGGMIFLLADTAFAYACNSRNVSTVAQNATISFLAPSKQGDVLVAEARETALVGRSGIYQISIRSSDGVHIAELTGLSRSIGGAVVD